MGRKKKDDLLVNWIYPVEGLASGRGIRQGVKVEGSDGVEQGVLWGGLTVGASGSGSGSGERGEGRENN